MQTRSVCWSTRDAESAHCLRATFHIGTSPSCSTSSCRIPMKKCQIDFQNCQQMRPWVALVSSVDTFHQDVLEKNLFCVDIIRMYSASGREGRPSTYTITGYVPPISWAQDSVAGWQSPFLFFSFLFFSFPSLLHRCVYDQENIYFHKKVCKCQFSLMQKAVALVTDKTQMSCLQINKEIVTNTKNMGNFIFKVTFSIFTSLSRRRKRARWVSSGATWRWRPAACWGSPALSHPPLPVSLPQPGFSGSGHPIKIRRGLL